MARTPEGRALTQAERVRANARAETLGRRVSRHFGFYMRPDNIDARRSEFVAQVTAETVAVADKQRQATASYLRRHAAAEGEEITVVTPTLSTASVAETITINGPVAFKAAKARGADDAHALALARTRASMAARGIVLDTQRRTTIGTARANGGRWRRVTDGHPCAFCAMLAGRGPVYAEDTVDFEAHSRCGCTSEMSFETVDEWVRQYATDTETAWINAYFDAAEEASDSHEPRVAPVRKRGRERDTVLYRMRRQHPGLFHDGVLPRH